MNLRKFRDDKRGIVLAGIIAISFIILSSIIWLAGALAVNMTFDELSPIIAECDPHVAITAQNAVNAYGVSIVVIDVLLLIWWALVAQKREVVDEPAGFY